MHRPLATAALALALGLAPAGPAHAIAFTIYTQLADWQAAAGPETLQDFSGYANGDSVLNTAVLPGVTATTNLGSLEVFGASKGMTGFGAGSGSRAAGNAYYQLDVGNAYRAMALDIGAFESALPPYNLLASAVDAGQVEVLFADNFSLTYSIFGNDGQNIFFGLVSDTPITRIRWIEAHEQSGVNEETRLDNLRAALPASVVPEPSSLALVAAGLLGWAARRRQARA